MRGRLIRRSVALNGDYISVSYFAAKELTEACKEVPALTGLAQRKHLWPILCWPKALDLVATYGRGTNNATEWASESDFAQWFWKSIISQEKAANPRDRVARELGVQLGDHMSNALSLEKFDTSELPVLEELASEGHLEIDRNQNTIRFSHELLADWARTRELQIQGNAVAAFLLHRLSSPLWHRAVRYHALARLEQNTDSKAWLGFFNQFRGNATINELAKNLLLEAPIFAVDQCATLERLWPLFESNEGVLLVRFLRQFLRVGTIPDRYVLQMFQDQSPEQMLALEASHRVPWAPYWFGVIQFLGQHGDRVVALAPEETADLCLHWLAFSQATQRGMETAAHLAVALARQAYRGAQHKSHRSRHEASPKEKAYRALLAAAPVIPEAVTDLVLKLSGRRLPQPGDVILDNKFPRPRSIPDRGPLRPWAEGPVCRPSRAFTRAFMAGHYSTPLFDALPTVGSEAMFGLLLNLPHANDSFDDFGLGFQMDEHGFNSGSDLPRSVYWTNGPFVAFLNANPDVALQAIIRLVNFATDRALELPEVYRPRLSVPVRVNDQTNIWRGHTRSFVWHKGHVFGPKAVCCALLSLEKWFYLQIEVKQSIDRHLITVLEQSRSIALAGVLVEVGKKNPDLFLGPMRSIIEALEFSWIEYRLRQDNEGAYIGASFDVFGGEAKIAHQWATLPHREVGLNELVVRMFRSDPRWQSMIDEFKPRWTERLNSKENPASEFFASAVRQFETANWKTETKEGKTYITYTPPADLPQPPAEELAQRERTELLLFIPVECQRMLHREIDSPEEKITAWWAIIPKIEAQQVPEDQQDYRSASDALLGIVAVAVVLHRPWLAADPDREKEACRLLFETGEHRRRSWATPDATIDYKWDNFAAWAMTTLWCEHPDYPALREGVSGLVMWERYNVVERVMLIAADKRDQLGHTFDALLAHALRYAILRDRIHADREWNKITFDHTAAMKQHYEAFLDEKTEPMPTSWKTIASPKPPGHYRQSGGIDMMQLYSALTWAQDLSLARDVAEKNDWIRMHREVLLCGIARLERLATMIDEKDDDDGQLLDERAAYRGEEELLRRIGQIVARMAPGENHRQLWEPILALGSIGERWISTFLSAWFLEARAHHDVRSAMAEQWIQMLEFGSSSSAWAPDKLGWQSGRDLWDELLGMRTLGWSYWDERMIPVVQAVREYHEAWAIKHAASTYDTIHYLIFLGHKAARGTRIGGLLTDLPPNPLFFAVDYL